MWDWVNHNSVPVEGPNNRYPLARQYDAESVVADTTITVAIIKQYLRIASTVTDENDYLIMLLDTAISMFETATGVTILLTDWLTYRDDFNGRQFVLGKRKYKSLTDIKYTDIDDVVQTIDATNYYVTDEYPFSRVILKDDKLWGDANIIIQKQAVKIRFRAGLSDDAGVYPIDVKTALLALIASMYVNRGDCDTSTLATMKLPPLTNAVVAKYRALYLQNTNYLEDYHGMYT